MYLWLNYAIFEQLVGSDSDMVEDVFRNALLQVKNIEARKKIWQEYVFRLRARTPVDGLLLGT
jgi:hypothetical protein